MAPARLPKSPILTWECITALTIRWAWLTSSPWAVWWPLYFFAVRQVHSVDIEFLLCALSVWCGCSRTRYHCRVKDLVDVNTQNPLVVGGEILIQKKPHPQARKKQDSKMCMCLLYIILSYMVAQLFYPDMTLFWQKTSLKIEKDS